MHILATTIPIAKSKILIIGDSYIYILELFPKTYVIKAMTKSLRQTNIIIYITLWTKFLLLVNIFFKNGHAMYKKKIVETNQPVPINAGIYVGIIVLINRKLETILNNIVMIVPPSCNIKYFPIINGIANVDIIMYKRYTSFILSMAIG